MLVKIKWENGKIACCKQECDRKCTDFSKCREYAIEPRKVRKKEENISFNYFEKMMSEGGSYRQIK